MPLVQVRDFPDALYEKLQRAASAEHRSVPQQVVAFVEHSLVQGDGSFPQTSTYAAERAKLFAAIANDAPEGKAEERMPSDAELVRRGRDAR